MSPLFRPTLLALLVLLTAPARAEGPPELYTLVTPASPAFIVLGVAPSEIQRPTDPVTLANSLANAFTTSGGVGLPSNLALEFAPYWLFSHPLLTREEYQAPSPRSLYRKLTLSIATAPSTPSPADSTTYPRMGLGLRTRLLDGRPAEAGVCQEVLARFTLSLGEFIATLEPPPTDAESLRKAHEEWLTSNRPALEAALAENQCVERASVREGLVADFALASVLDFPTGDPGRADLTTASAWLSAGYLLPQLSFLALARAQVERTPTTPWQRYVDVGARALWAHSRYGLSVEGVLRVPVASPDAPVTYRLALVSDLQLVEGLWLALSMGRGFGNAVREGEFFALANLEFAFDDQRRIDWEALLPSP